MQALEQQDDRRATVVTEKQRPKSPSMRFHLQRLGGVWLIASLERLGGDGKWAPAAL